MKLKKLKTRTKQEIFKKFNLSLIKNRCEQTEALLTKTKGDQKKKRRGNEIEKLFTHFILKDIINSTCRSKKQKNQPRIRKEDRECGLKKNKSTFGETQIL